MKSLIQLEQELRDQLTPTMQRVFSAQISDLFGKMAKIDVDSIVKERLLGSKAEHVRQAVQLIIVQEFGITYDELKSKLRKREFVTARQFAMYFLKLHGLTLERCGNEFNRDHATVIHAARQINNLCEMDRPFRNLRETLRERIQTEIEYLQEHDRQTQMDKARRELRASNSYIQGQALEANAVEIVSKVTNPTNIR